MNQCHHHYKVPSMRCTYTTGHLYVNQGATIGGNRWGQPWGATIGGNHWDRIPILSDTPDRHGNPCLRTMNTHQHTHHASKGNELAYRQRINVRKPHTQPALPLVPSCRGKFRPRKLNSRQLYDATQVKAHALGWRDRGRWELIVGRSTPPPAPFMTPPPPPLPHKEPMEPASTPPGETNKKRQAQTQQQWFRLWATTHRTRQHVHANMLCAKETYGQ